MIFTYTEKITKKNNDTVHNYRVLFTRSTCSLEANLHQAVAHVEQITMRVKIIIFIQVHRTILELICILYVDFKIHQELYETTHFEASHYFEKY